MLVLRDVEHFKVYYPKLDIKACLTLDSIYGSITKPLQEAHKTETLLFVLSLLDALFLRAECCSLI